MQFLKTLFWVILAVVAVVFAMRNWTVVSLSLWGGLILDAKLPVLLLIAFLAGLLPAWGLLAARSWRLKRRLDATERALADTRHDPETPPPVAARPAISGGALDVMVPPVPVTPPVVG